MNGKWPNFASSKCSATMYGKSPNGQKKLNLLQVHAPACVALVLVMHVFSGWNHYLSFE